VLLKLYWRAQCVHKEGEEKGRKHEMMMERVQVGGWQEHTEKESVVCQNWQRQYHSPKIPNTHATCPEGTAVR
jgi:hypothetical protein